MDRPGIEPGPLQWQASDQLPEAWPSLQAHCMDKAKRTWDMIFKHIFYSLSLLYYFVEALDILVIYCEKTTIYCVLQKSEVLPHSLSGYLFLQNILSS